MYFSTRLGYYERIVSKNGIRTSKKKGRGISATT